MGVVLKDSSTHIIGHSGDAFDILGGDEEDVAENERAEFSGLAHDEIVIEDASDTDNMSNQGEETDHARESATEKALCAMDLSIACWWQGKQWKHL